MSKRKPKPIARPDLDNFVNQLIHLAKRKFTTTNKIDKLLAAGTAIEYAMTLEDFKEAIEFENLNKKESYYYNTLYEGFKNYYENI